MTNSKTKSIKKKRRCNRKAYSVLLEIMTILMIVFMVVPFVSLFRIYGVAMKPTVNEGEVVICVKTPTIEVGDVIAFQFGRKTLIRRVIAGPGSVVRIDDQGIIYVDGERLEEAYLEARDLGNCNIPLPFRVPRGEYFVMGDNRRISIDSRHTSMGCVSDEEIEGQVVFSVWPLDKFREIE